MASITIRGIDDITAKRLKDLAKKEGLSINALVLKILRQALGIEKKKRAIIYTDLDELAGTWTEEEYQAFLKNIEPFEQIDEEMWKT